MQSCKVQSGKSVFVLYIDPGLELVLEGWVVAVVLVVLSREGLEMQHVDLEF